MSISDTFIIIKLFLETVIYSQNIQYKKFVYNLFQ